MRLRLFWFAPALLLSGCASTKVENAPPPPSPKQPATVSPGAKSDYERRIARLEMSLMEKDAQVDDLQSRLDATRQEVVRAMAKLQTLATRAEAASGIAEAELALQPLRSAPGQPAAPEAAQARRLLQESSSEFEKANYGGALYLANQAKTVAAAGRGRLTTGQRVVERPGETPFNLPIPLKAISGGNVREGPGLGSKVTFSVQPGDSLTGYSYADEWIRISDEEGRGGWIFRSLVVRR
ncbi:MAG TPA: SH3 domain-containing protein [Gemmatimonadales bacterium]|nr:SH3 domain-containing protein [Gemmatimonadales bacterium]